MKVNKYVALAVLVTMYLAFCVTVIVVTKEILGAFS